MLLRTLDILTDVCRGFPHSLYVNVRIASMFGETRNAFRILVGKSEGKRPLGRPRRRWVYNIKMDPKRDGMGWYGLD
jgi:hypothetical protein